MTKLPLKQYLMAAGQVIALLAVLGIISTEQATSLTEVGGAVIAAIVALATMLGTLVGILHSIWSHHTDPKPTPRTFFTTSRAEALHRDSQPQPPPPSPDVTLLPGEMFLRRRSDDHPRLGPD